MEKRTIEVLHYKPEWKSLFDAEQELFEAKVNLLAARRDEAVARYTILSVSGGMTAKDLNLPVKIYDPSYHYRLVKEKWIGFDENKEGSSIFDMELPASWKKNSFFDFLY